MISRYRSSNSASWRAYSSLRDVIAEEGPRRLDRLHQHVHLSQGVVQVEAGAGGPGNAQGAHQRLCAVVAGADCHTVAVQDGTHVMRMQVVHVEGDHTGPLA